MEFKHNLLVAAHMKNEDKSTFHIYLRMHTLRTIQVAEVFSEDQMCITQSVACAYSYFLQVCV
jgi:hypothetical protein